MKNKLKIEIEITKIDVDSEGYFTIDYITTINGKKKKGSYDSDFDGQLPHEFRKVLEDGHALEIVLERINEEIDL